MLLYYILLYCTILYCIILNVIILYTRHAYFIIHIYISSLLMVNIGDIMSQLWPQITVMSTNKSPHL